MSKNIEFDLDDPLGDILSDESTDGFYSSNIVKSNTVTTVKTETPKHTEKSKTISDLFGISDSKDGVDERDGLFAHSNDKKTSSLSYQVPTETVYTAPRSLETGAASIIPTKSYTKVQEKTVHFDSNDILKDILPSTRKSDLFQGDILDDILGKQSTKTTAFKTEKPIEKSISAVDQADVTNTSSGMNFGGYAPSLSGTRESRRTGRPNTGQVNDPLGLFAPKATTESGLNVKSGRDRSNEKKPSVEPTNRNVDWLGLDKKTNTETKQNAKATEVAPESDLPGWLGGSSSKKDKPKVSIPAEEKEILLPPAQKVPEEVTEVQVSTNIVVPNHSSSAVSYPTTSYVTNTKDLLATRTGLTLANFNIEQQNAAIALQQQESQLVMAMHLRGQEEQMVALQRRQQDVLDRQERHFRDLIEQQLNRQQALEENLRRQQEQINNHIQILLTQPSAVPIFQQSSDTRKENSYTQEKSTATQNVSNPISLETETQLYKNSYRNDKEIIIQEQENIRLKQEKQYLEESLFIIKEKHNQEIEMLEESYKRQLSVIENSMQHLETRLKNENESLSNFYTEKLKVLENDKKGIIEKYEEKLRILNIEYKEDIERVQEKHKQDIETMRLEHQQTIENIRHAKLIEASLVQESASHSFALKGATELLQRSCGDLTVLNKSWEQLTQEREERLHLKEQELKLMQESLTKTRDQAEADRIRLMDMVQSLEVKLMENTQNLTDEKWTIRQQQASLTAKEQALEREKQFIREQAERDATRIETLKQELFAQNEQLTLKMEEERRNLNASKLRLETMERVQNLHDPKNNRAEIESAIDAANDAVKLAEHERRKLLEQQRNMQIKLRELQDKEAALQVKSNELDIALDKALNNQRLSERAIQSARTAEQDFHLKSQSIQAKLSNVALRENKLAQEKQLFAKERISLIMLKKSLESRQCSLCKIGEGLDIKKDVNSKTNTSIVNDLEQLKVDQINSYETVKVDSLGEPGPWSSANIHSLDELNERFMRNLQSFANMESNVNRVADSLGISNITGTNSVDFEQIYFNDVFNDQQNKPERPYFNNI